MKPAAPSSQKPHPTIIFFAYIIFASFFGYAYRYAMNPDGISQLRLAAYIADGNFLQSITPTWSPFMIWLMSLPLYLGIDGLTSARIVIALCGFGLVLGSLMLSERFALSRNSRFAAVLIAALLIADWSIRNIGSDLLVAAMVTWYFYLVLSPEILRNRSLSFLCGIVGGFSYLAHHYALPFFLAHFPATLLLKGYLNSDEKGRTLKKIFISLLAGVAGLCVVLSIWITIVSIKYGQLTITNKSHITYAVVGPKDKDRRHPFFVGGLFKPKDTYAMHVFEDPSEVEFKIWSPFESKEYFMHQLELIKDNSIHIFNHFIRESPFFTYAFIIATLSLFPIAFLANPLNSERKFLYIWIVMTFIIYCSGYVLVIARSPRRFYALMIIFLLISFHFLETLKNGIHNTVSDKRRKILFFYLLMVVILAFAFKPAKHFLKSVNNSIAVDQVNPYKEIADQIRAVPFPSPYAIVRSSQKPHTDLYIAYYLEKQLLGRPLSQDVEGITKELRAVDGKSLIVFDNPELTTKLRKDKRYIHLAFLKLKNVASYKHTVDINIKDHEIITGWDSEVTIFTLK